MMTDVIVECSYGNCDDLDCAHFPKRICTLSDQIGILVCSCSSLSHYLKLINKYGAQLCPSSSKSAYVSIGNIKIDLKMNIYEIDLNDRYHNGKLLMECKDYEEVYKYLNDNGHEHHEQNLMIEMKFVD